MALQLTEEQVELRAGIRRLLERNWTRAQARALVEDPLGFSPGLYRRLLDAQLREMAVPEAGADLVDLAVVVEELGYHAVVSPLVDDLVAQRVLAELGASEPAGPVAPDALGITVCATREPGFHSSTERITARLSPADGGGLRLDGTKVFVPWAHAAERFLVWARLAPTDELRVVAVPAGAPGVEITPVVNAAADRWCDVRFDGVALDAGAVLGDADAAAAAARVHDAWLLLHCADRVGGAQAAVDMTLDHLRTREQYGKPLGAFQALQYRMLDLVMALDHARLLTYHAAWVVAQGLDADREVAMAKGAVSATYADVTDGCTHLHGAYALIHEHDLSVYFQRSLGSIVTLGHPDDWLDLLARDLHRRAVDELAAAGEG